MGQEFSGLIRNELLNSKKIAGYNPVQLKLLREKFVLVCDDDLSIDVKSFMEILRIKEDEAKEVFKLFDIDGSGKIDSYEFICGIALLGYGTLRDKAEVIFSLFDFDNSLVLNRDELIVLFRCVLCSMQAMCGKKSYPSIVDVEKKVNSILSKYDMSGIQQITLNEFQSLIAKDMEILTLLKSYNLLLSDDLRDVLENDNEVIECDSDIETELQKDSLAKDLAFTEEEASEGSEMTKIPGNLELQVFEDRTNSLAKYSVETRERDKAPAAYKNFQAVQSPPDVIVEPVHIYGYRGYDTRNNIRLAPNSEVVTFTGKVAWVMNRKPIQQGQGGQSGQPGQQNQSNNQRLFQYHTNPISCMTNFESFFVTAELGKDPLIHIWDSKSLQVKASLKGVLREGISHVCISNDGKRLAAVETAEHHTTVIYDFNKITTSKLGSITGEAREYIVAVFQGPQRPIFDMIFHNNDATIMFASKKGLFYAHIREDLIEVLEIPKNSDNPQSTLCLGSWGQSLVAGNYSGKIVVYKGFSYSGSYDAHKGPVGALWARKGEMKSDKGDKGGFITGGYDGSVIVWDNSYNKIVTYALTDFKMALLSYKIKSVCEDSRNNDIVIGTKAGDIIEVVGGQMKMISKGHLGQLTGLDKVGNREEVATVGKDKDLVIWDLGKMREKKIIPLEFEGSQVACSPDGSHIAVGFVNGYVEIIESTNTTVIKKMKDRTVKICLMKYSNDQNNQILAVGAVDNELILYRSKDNYKIIAKIKGLKAAPIAIDFSEDAKSFQLVDKSFTIKYYETSGTRRPGSIFEHKDERWSSWTIPIGWTVHGLFRDSQDVGEITTVCLNPDKTLLAVGMFNGDVRFYRYPVIGNPVFIKYTAHSSPVSKIIFTDTGHHIVSIGSDDRAVLQWRYDPFEDKDKGSAPKSEIFDKDEEYFRYLQGAFRPDELPLKPEEIARTYLSEVKGPIRDEIKVPSRQGEAPDQNLELKHIFGCKFEGSTHFCKFSTNGAVVFFSGNKGIVKEPIKDSKIQSFFTKHTNNIQCMDIHKNKEWIATGETTPPGFHGQIYIWSFDTKAIQASLKTNGRGGVIKLKFSTEGTKLISVSNDEEHMIDIFDVATSRLLTSIMSESRAILDISFKSETEFVSITNTNVRFWEIKGANTTSIRGNWLAFSGIEKPDKDEMGKRRDKDSEGLVSCIYAFLQNICFTGTSNGNIYTWQGGAFQKSVNGHGSSAVRTMICFKNLLYTGGDDGKIKSWSYSGKLQPQREVVFQVNLEKEINYEVRSLDMSSEGVFLVGTNKARIFMATETSFDILVESHYSKGINAVAVHPTTAQFITAADDMRMIKWDAASKTQSEVKPFKDSSDIVVALDWSQDGEIIIAATAGGKVHLFDKSMNLKNSASSIFNKEGQRISVIKISPNNSRVALGSTKSNQIQVIDIIEKDKSMSPAGTITDDLTSGCRFLDWSVDGDYIACCLDSYEIRFYIMKDYKNVGYAYVKDKNWVTWTQPLGLLVRGIEVDSQALKYSPVCRSQKYSLQVKDTDFEHDKKQIRLFLVTGNREGNIQLYRYPTIVENSDFRQYNSHARNVTGVRIFSNDNFVVAISDKDNSIVIFETDFKNDTKNVDALEAEPNKDKEPIYDPNNEVLVRPSERNRAAEKTAKREEIVQDKKDISKMYKGNTVDDKTKFSNPWLAAIRYPTEYLKPPVNNEKPPKLKVTPEYVFGFRTKDCRGNLKYINSTEVIYSTAALVVVHDLSKKTQRFFQEHESDVTCLAFRANPDLVASGEVADDPDIYIWNPKSLSVMRHIKAYGLMGLSKVKFNTDGSYLLSLSVDPHNTISVFSTSTGVQVHSIRGDSLKILDAIWTSSSEFVSVGIMHIKYWRIESNQVKMLRGKQDIIKQGNQRMLCCSVNKKDVLVGTTSGNLLVWKRPQESPTIYNLFKSEKGDKGGSIDCISVTEQNIFLAGKEGIIHIMTNAYVDILKVYLPELAQKVLNWRIRAIDTADEGKRIILGTFSSEIYQLSSPEVKVSSGSRYNATEVNKGVFTLNSVEKFEMNGLAVFRNPENANWFVTCSDDGLLRIWSAEDKQLVRYIELLSNSKGDMVTGSDDTKLRCLAISPKEDMIAVGCKSGAIRIINLHEMRQVQMIEETKNPIREIKFSPNGSMLAVAAEDNRLEIYSVPDFRRRATLKKHAGPVNHLDWSLDSHYIQTTSESQELLFFNAQDYNHLTDLKSNVRNETWASQTCVYGWAVQGIWKDYMVAGTEINMVDRSNHKFFKEYQVLATVDDFSEINIYKYPCVQPAAESVTLLGHSSFISNVKWTSDDRRLITIGGEDQTIIIWKVEKSF